MFSAITRGTVTPATRTARALFSTAQCRRKDPWPLPHTPEHLANTQTPSDIPPLPPIERVNESLQTMRARLIYQSRKRGTLESDLLLSTFANENLVGMTEAELKEYDKLLDEPDWDIYYWATGKRAVPERWQNSTVLAKLRVHARNEGKAVRSMPSL
ncbi:Succinate dehydrogenase assembly factor 2 mitochondrial [Marasmius crinis-equi]|uniref:Succinate dehydrogenase assembly factor 2, mitochondrial n=1 Tax=Marasmius crinis-equi TaxID=585013 RepID=A0ABR3G205_9AGAR